MTDQSKIIRWFVLLGAATTLYACSDKGESRQDQPHIATDAEGEYSVSDDETEGLKLTLSETQAPKEEVVRPRTVEGTPLSKADTEALLARLPDLPDEEKSQSEFAFRKRSKPAPRTGETVETAFPPAEEEQAPDKATEGPLEVLRHAPEGEVELAPKLSVTFSQPMVAVTSQEQAAETVPARIEPAVDGKWRWIGTRTALFEPAGERFPMATDYQVTVPADLESTSEESLEKPVSWKFVTPAVELTQVYPAGGAQKRQPLIFMEFNQRVSPDDILEAVAVRANSKRYAVTRATDEQIEADESVRRLVEQARPHQWVAFRTDQKLPAGTDVEVALTKGAPSAEGPKRTQQEQSRRFRTYDPLRVEQHNCDAQNKCRPRAGWYIRFNNPLDPETVSEETVRIEPELDGLELRANYQVLYIRGRSEPRTDYKVTLGKALGDQFGQTLDEDQEVTFHVGPAQPMLGSSAGLMTVLDPAAKGRFPVFSTNYRKMRVRAYQVDPADWPKYLQFLQTYRRTDQATPPGKVVLDKRVAIEGEKDAFDQTLVDLSAALDKEGHGQLILHIEPTEPEPQKKNYYRADEVLTWVQCTDIAIDASFDQEELLAWTSSLADGSAIDGAKISLITGQKAKTDDAGLATLQLPTASQSAKLSTGNVLVASRGDDVAILPERTWYYAHGQSNWRQRADGPTVLWHVFDDRGMYKPGETVHLKGWLRKATTDRQDRLAMPSAEQVSYRVYGPRGNDLTRGTADVDDTGGFDFAVDLPDDVNLGYARVELTAAGGSTMHNFQIQEFRRPEFEVSVSTPAGPHLVGQSVTVDLDAHYYAGGGLPGAPVNWTVQTRPGHYTPPKRDDYVFGRWSPWWMPFSGGNQASSQSFSGHTDASGEHHLKIKFERANPPLPTVVEPTASVTDVNRQTWSDSGHMLVHPSEAYVGVKSAENFVGEDEPIRIDTIVTDIDGKLLEGRPVEMSAARIDWRFKNGQWTEVEADQMTCELSSAADPQTCEFQPKKGGVWRITAITRDERGRPNMSQLRVWVAGGERPPKRNAEQQEAELIPDKETYEAGDTAKILVRAPFEGAEALMTVRQNGLVSHERFHIDGLSHTVEVGISEADYPNVHVQVDLVGSEPRTTKAGEPVAGAPPKPAFASGSLSLKVPPKKRELAVTVKPDQAEVAPGTKTKIHLSVEDASGKPAANSEVALVAVDEAILALTGYTLADPIDSFYPDQPAGVSSLYLQQYLLLATNAELQQAQAEGNAEQDGAVMDEIRAPEAPAGATRTMAAPMEKAAFGRGAGGAGGPARPKPIALRKDFRALALFAPKVRTDANGEATVALDLPDNLTRYRLMAVAVSGDDHFGKGESTVTARLPLMVRPSPPRFLNWGDRMEMPVVIQNQTDKLAHVQVAVRAANLRFGDSAGRAVDVPAGDRVEVRFKAVTEKAGEAIVQVATSSGNWADAAQKKLPVWTPATTEAFATYGTVDKGAVDQPIEVPDDVIEQFGHLEVTTSSTALQELTDALIYLVDYPYDCSEQIASRVLGVAALKDVLEAFDAEGLPSKKKLVAAVGRDIEVLGRLQRPDGGFYLWSNRDRYRHPFVEIHVTHALQRAKMKGFDVPDAMLEKAGEHIANIEAFIPSDYSEKARNAVRAYAYYVLNVMGQTARAQDLAHKLAAKKPGDELSLEAIGWLMNTLAGDKTAASQLAKFERFIQNRVSETAATAQFNTSYGGKDHVLMYSSRRTDAVLLDAMIAAEPNSDLIPKLVRGLLDHRTRGHWLNTQENVFVLLALDRYFQAYEKQTPNFVTRMWLGDGYVGEHAFKGRSTERKQVNIPMEALVDIADGDDKPRRADLLMQKEGKGRMYYRIGMSYAPESLDLEAADYGFAVERRYEAVDDPADVQQRKDGTWEVKAGARVRVKLTMVAPARRYHVALVDALPAGLEPINPALAVSEPVPAQQNQPQQRFGPYWWWFMPWYSHQNLRDERAEAFAPIVWAGVHEYSYVARATTPGEFVVPPTKAEEMYHPETFGRTGTDHMVVK